MSELYDQTKWFGKLFGGEPIEPDWKLVSAVVGPETAATLQAEWQLAAIEDRAIEFGASFS